MRSFFKSFGLAALLVSSSLSLSEVSATEPYDSIRLLSHQPYYLESGYILLDEVNSTNTSSSTNSSFFLDVESPNGEGARFVTANNPNVTAIAINSWSGENQYHQFLSDVQQENLGNRIIPLRMSSAEASNALNLSANVIYIDSSDSDTLQEKISMWLTFLADNGVIAGNHWQSIGVELAVVNAAAQLNLLLNTNGNYWFLTRP